MEAEPQDGKIRRENCRAAHVARLERSLRGYQVDRVRLWLGAPLVEVIWPSMYEVGLLIWAHRRFLQDFPGGPDSKESTCNAGDSDSILGLGRSPGGEGMAIWSSILAWRIPTDRGAFSPWGCKRVRHDWATNTLFFSKFLQEGRWSVVGAGEIPRQSAWVRRKQFKGLIQVKHINLFKVGNAEEWFA